VLRPGLRKASDPQCLKVSIKYEYLGADSISVSLVLRRRPFPKD
jgi:hypothetical protein